MAEKQSYQPSAALSRFIERYWFWSPGTKRSILLLPGTGMDFFIHIGHPFFVERVDSVEQEQCPEMHALCVRNRCIRIITDETTCFMSVRFRGGMFRHFCSMFVPELYDQLVHAGEWLGKDAVEELRLLREDRTPQEQVALLNSFWEKRLENHRRNDLWLDRMNAKLYYHQSLSIEQVARMMGASRRHVERVYQARFGMSPKRYQQICRLQHTCRDVWLNQRDWLDSALDHGYYDQAHSIRECKRITGFTPGRLGMKHQMSHLYNPPQSGSCI